MQRKTPDHKPLAILLRGLAMGTVDIVPGVSGGTIHHWDLPKTNSWSQCSAN